MGPYTTAIFRLTHAMRRYGVRLNLYVSELPCAGMYRSETNEVFINESDSRQALIVLAHEMGHVLGHASGKHKRHSYQRERQAFVYGWRLLLAIGADGLVSRQSWIEHHRAIRGLPDVDTSAVASRLFDD